MHIPDALIHSSSDLIGNHSMSNIVSEGIQQTHAANRPTPLVGALAHD